VFNSPSGGVPLGRSPRNVQWMSTDGEVPNAVEILPKIWTAWVGRTSVTDRQTTDRQTTDDRRMGDTRSLKSTQSSTWDDPTHVHLCTIRTDTKSRPTLLPRKSRRTSKACGAHISGNANAWHKYTQRYTQAPTRQSNIADFASRCAIYRRHLADDNE